MPKGFLPNPDAALLAWSVNFSSIINADPGAVGLTAPQAANYALLHADFAAKYAACDPGVRCKSAVTAKNESREKLKTDARQLARAIYGTASVTDAQKLLLGLSVRGKPTPIPPPADAPQIVIGSVSGWAVNFQLRDQANGICRKPAGAQGASLFSFAAPVGSPASFKPPTDLQQWTFEGNFGKTRLEFNFPSNLPPGTKVWLAAFWFNPRSQGGPVSAPVSTYLQGGSVALAA